MRDETSREIGFVIIGALATLVLVTGTAILVGYSLTEALEGNNLLGRIHYVLVVSALGAGLTVAWRRSTHITAIGGVIGLMGILGTNTPEFSTPLTSLNIALTVLAVLFIHAASIEYGLRNPADVRRIFTHRAVTAGIVTGSLHVGTILIARTWLGFYSASFSASAFRNISNIGMTVWMVGGAIIVGFIVGLLLARYRLVAPILTVVGLLSWATYETWQSIPPSGASVALVGYLLTLYLWGWYLILGLALAAGLIEYVLRLQSRRLFSKGPQFRS